MFFVSLQTHKMICSWPILIELYIIIYLFNLSLNNSFKNSHVFFGGPASWPVLLPGIYGHSQNPSGVSSVDLGWAKEFLG